MSSIGGFSFSWKKQLGITKRKRKISRKSPIPLSRATLDRRVGKLARGGYLKF